MSNLNNKWAKLPLPQLGYLCLFFGLASSMSVREAQAEPVSDNSTGTTVTTNGNQFDISGGTKAGDNLFHSFKKFGLSKDQIANFLSNPNIRNILGRVTGGDASIINGLIQVTGGNSNLFLINPAGIIFGKDATLNLPASFTATTANGIQIGDFWFDALGSNNYSNLVGEPNGFAFVTDTPGSIINAGNLSVARGETINLVGGVVINTGTLEAPEGKINITAVPEKQLVKISPEGSLLSLALPTQAESILGAELITPQDLPTLLTGGDIQVATGVEVADNGTIKLTNSDTVIPSDVGTAIASGSLDVSGNIGGKVNVLGDKVGVVAGNINAFGTNGGGTVLIGGNYRGQGEVPNALRTFIDSNSVINADAVENGDGGKVIAWADEVTAFYGNISATGGSNSGDGGFVEVSGKDGLIFEGDVDLTAINGNDGMLLLDPAIIRIVGEGDDETQNNEFNIDDTINVLNTSDLPEEPEGGFTISIDRLVNKKVTLEATEKIIFERNTLVSVVDVDNLQFIGALIDPETEGVSNNGTTLQPVQDIPRFKELNLKVDPPEDQRGTINILGSFAVTKKLTIENTNGDINIDLLLPNQVKFEGDKIVELSNNRGSIFVDIDSLLNGVEPNGNNRTGVGSATIRARQGNVELNGGITLNAVSDLTIEAQRFTATNPVTLQGNSSNGQPGRNEIQDQEATYNIGVVYFGGQSKDIPPKFDAETNEVIIAPNNPADQVPNVKFTLSFADNEPNTEILPGDPGTPGTDATAEININLLKDIFFEFDEDADFIQSGIQIDIQRFFRIGTDGSIGAGNGSLFNNAFQGGLFDDDRLAEEESEIELVAIKKPDETQTASFCDEELNITSLPNSDKVKATCGDQALAFVFSQPTDENGNPIAITEDLFPELLTGDEIIEIDENTSFNFWIPQNKEGNFVEVTFGKHDLQYKIEN